MKKALMGIATAVLTCGIAVGVQAGSLDLSTLGAEPDSGESSVAAQVPAAGQEGDAGAGGVEIVELSGFAWDTDAAVWAFEEGAGGETAFTYSGIVSGSSLETQGGGQFDIAAGFEPRHWVTFQGGKIVYDGHHIVIHGTVDQCSEHEGGDDHEGGGTGVPVPEPSMMLLLGAGLIGVAALRRRAN